MRNQIIDGVEYAVNLNGERYEVMIPGTKCPVSAGVLEEWYWSRESNTLKSIAKKISNEWTISCTGVTVRNWMKRCNIRTRPRNHPMTIRQCTSNLIYKPNGRSLENLSKLAKMRSKIDRMKQIKAVTKANKKRICRLRVVCDYCNKEFEKVPSAVGKQNFCSRSCSSSRKSRVRIGVNGVRCPKCFSIRISLQSNKHGYFASVCRECKASSVRPLLGFGLRQDLEASGALDDGRILASAFKDKE
jgi:hypothetical protein